MKNAILLLMLLLIPTLVSCMTNSKLSIHTSMGTNSWNVVKNGQPRVIKLLDSFGDAASIKQTVPGIIIVGRIYLPNQPTDGDPVQAAKNWWSQCNRTILSSPAVDYWEGYNEPPVGNLNAMFWYSQMEVTRVEILASHGLYAAIGCFSTGVPDVTTPSIIQAFYPAIDAAIAHKGVLALHEYSSPTMTGVFDNSTGEGWLTGRYRKLYRQYLIPTHRALPLVVTENGIGLNMDMEQTVMQLI
eukprot:TRINITY_DN976_c0_g1_i3.p2 TRINITY_DN976_c0_g1~~TRINITY_DN976_c0_g1_i3.p2  ORF type:complete len:243 (-),score=29.79 TRINITY_DN976_c0_g1_i3:197-925(-)